MRPGLRKRLTPAAALLLLLSRTVVAAPVEPSEVAQSLTAAIRNLDAPSASKLFDPHAVEHGPLRLRELSGAPPGGGYRMTSFVESLSELRSSLRPELPAP